MILLFLRYDYVIYSRIGLVSFLKLHLGYCIYQDGEEVHQHILLPPTSSLQVELEKLSIMYAFNFSVYDVISKES